MMSPLNWNIEYLTRLMSAMGSIETRILEHVPPDIPMKDKFGKLAGAPLGQEWYQRSLEKFKAEVSDSRSISVLVLLYHIEKYFQHDRDAFTLNFENYFSILPEKWISILYNYPKIDQTTLCCLLPDISDTIVGYRLEALTRIGLVRRSGIKPPHPKHVTISANGVTVIESAIKDGANHLAPLFNVETTFAVQSVPGNILIGKRS
jgi:hypothetical protein